MTDVTPDKDAISNLIGEFAPDLEAEPRNWLERELERSIKKDINTPPVVTIIGPTGVGKSTTINCLFGANEKVNPVIPETAYPVRLKIKPRPDNSVLRPLDVYDMPGIGHDIDEDEKHLKMYAEIISQSDVAVWILAATDRRISEDQRVIRDIVAISNPNILTRLVIGINKVDLLPPYNWNEQAFLPSEKQKELIDKKRKYVFDSISKVCPQLTLKRIVAYSAEKKYRLYDLFSAMMEACPPKRRFVLNSRQSVSDPLEDLISNFLNMEKNRESP